MARASVVVALLAASCLVVLGGVVADADAVGADATVGDADGPTVAVESNETAVGERAVVPVVLSSAPDGVSGFELTVSVADADVVEVVDARYGDGFALNESPAVADDGTSVTLEAADVDDGVEPGATDAVLAYVVVEGVTDGESAVDVTVERIDDDDGASFQPATSVGTIRVGDGTTTTTTATTTTTRSSGGGGGGGGAGGDETSTTATPTTASTEDATTSTAEPTEDAATTTTAAPTDTEADGSTTEYGESTDADGEPTDADDESTDADGDSTTTVRETTTAGETTATDVTPGFGTTTALLAVALAAGSVAWRTRRH